MFTIFPNTFYPLGFKQLEKYNNFFDNPSLILRVVRQGATEWKYFKKPPFTQLCIVFDLDRSLIGEDLRLPADERDPTAQIVLRPGVIDFLEELKERGHKIILWSNSPKEWWFAIREKFPELDIFDEYYFKEDGLGGILFTGQRLEYSEFKDLRILGADFLVDDQADEMRELIESENLNGLKDLVDSYIDITEFYCDGTLIGMDEDFETDEWVFPVARKLENNGG